jgi:glucose/arabinose dehydrogenase
MGPIRFAVALLVVLLAMPAALAQTAPFKLAVVAEGLSQPLFATAPPGDPRLFIVEQTGAIRILTDGAMAEQPFLEIRDLISLGGERGLLGLAFHPDYAATGRFYVNYTDRRGDTQVVGYSVSSDPGAADPGSAQLLFSVDQPRSNHNGGWLGFGPDGLLYVAMGDGGGAGDTPGNAQNPASLLGKILRLDVDAGGGPEVFATGARNPWRNAFDGDNLYIADVGQNEWEEINVVSIGDAGVNLGWNIIEGSDCFRPIENCDQSGLTLPVHTYSHDDGCSITGGYVYRGSAIPAIAGRYFFADYCTGTIWSLTYTDGNVSDVVSYADSLGSVGQITSFGLDSTGEMYLTTQDGIVRKFVPAS